MPRARAKRWICSRNGLVNAFVGSASAATRLAEGNNSRTNSRLLPASSAVAADNPVTLPPGLARLAIKPVPTGSPEGAMTIGISPVARLAA